MQMYSFPVYRDEMESPYARKYFSLLYQVLLVYFVIGLDQREPVEYLFSPLIPCEYFIV